MPGGGRTHRGHNRLTSRRETRTAAVAGEDVVALHPVAAVGTGCVSAGATLDLVMFWYVSVRGGANPHLYLRGRPSSWSMRLVVATADLGRVPPSVHCRVPPLLGMAPSVGWVGWCWRSLPDTRVFCFVLFCRATALSAAEEPTSFRVLACSSPLWPMPVGVSSCFPSAVVMLLYRPCRASFGWGWGRWVASRANAWRIPRDPDERMPQRG